MIHSIKAKNDHRVRVVYDGDEAFPQVILGAEEPPNEEVVKALREEAKRFIMSWRRHGVPWKFIWYFRLLLMLKRHNASFPVFKHCWFKNYTQDT